MKKSLLTAISCFLFALTYGQIQELPEGKHANYKLSTVNHAAVDGINHFDLDGTSKKYLVSLDFGKNTLNIQLYESATGKLVWGYYGTKGNVTFKPNREKSNETYAYYEFKQSVSGTITDCQVYYTHGLRGIEVTLGYSEVDIATKKVKRSIIASGQIN